MKTQGMMPRLKGSSGRLFSRGSFLNGKLRTFLGPGQRADSGMSGQPDGYLYNGAISDPGPVVSKDYALPTDWPHVGQLLRPIQTVAVSLCVALTYVTRDDEFGILSAEADRVSGLIDVAKSKLASIRPGRTFTVDDDWVTDSSFYKYGLVKWQYSSALTGRGVVTKPGSPTGTGYAWVDFKNSASDTFWPFPLPGPNASYYGTDFLHVFIGFPNLCDGDGWYQDVGQYFSEGSFSGDLKVFTQRPTGRTAFEQISGMGLDGAVDATRSRSAASKDRFARYAVRSFVTDVGIEPQPLSSDGLKYGGMYALTFYEDFANKFWGEAPSRFPDIDMKMVGTTGGLNSDSLVKLIADHFGFDPDTGIDLK